MQLKILTEDSEEMITTSSQNTANKKRGDMYMTSKDPTLLLQNTNWHTSNLSESCFNKLSSYSTTTKKSGKYDTKATNLLSVDVHPRKPTSETRV